LKIKCKRKRVAFGLNRFIPLTILWLLAVVEVEVQLLLWQVLAAVVQVRVATHQERHL
jgi:hypothetical protein